MNKTVKLFAVALFLIASTSLVKAMNENNINNNNNNNNNNEQFENNNKNSNPNNNGELNISREDDIKEDDIKEDDIKEDDIKEDITVENKSKKYPLVSEWFSPAKNEGKKYFDFGKFFDATKSKFSSKWDKSHWLGYRGLFVGTTAITTFAMIYAVKKVANKIKTRRMRARKLAKKSA